MKEKKEKVLLVTTDFFPQTGGISRWAYNQYIELRKNYDVQVLDKHKDTVKKTEKVEYYKDDRSLKHKVREKLKKSCYCKVLFFHWEAARPLFFYLKLKHIPYEIVLHGWEFLRPRSYFTEWIKKMILSWADNILVTSPYMKSQVLHYIRNQEKISLVGIPIDKNKFHRFPEKTIIKLKSKYKVNKRKIVISVGRLVERKDFLTVLKSIKLVKKKFPQILYIIIGNGPDRLMLESFIHQNQLSRNACLLGELSDKQLVEWYNISDIFVLTPKDIPAQGDVEGFGIVYHEAHFCGLPVIGSRTGGVEFALSLIDNSYLIDPGKYRDLAVLISRLLKEN